MYYIKITHVFAFYRNQFESEYQKFTDDVVGTTFEYVCQLIIKNSLDNIKRTQNALNSFQLASNTSKYNEYDIFLFIKLLKSNVVIYLLLIYIYIHIQCTLFITRFTTKI